MDRRNTHPTPPAGPAWAGWLYLGLAVLAGAQLAATVWQSGAGETAFLPSLVGVIAFPALAGAALLKRR
ncbi:hypothetical protein [Streptomyces lydicus]|uniref:hypothetical protein n=1 Tax=Streptomyces lydicus TaxID=47763 RepID=UPI000B330254|nr:hypothetical protein [Streptomyces lydicus]